VVQLPVTEDSSKPRTEAALTHMEQRQAEKAELWDKLTRSNWPPGRIEERLAAEFPDLLTPEQTEQRELAQQAALRRQAEAEAEPKRKPPTRYRHPRDKGPPPGIAKEIRGY